MAKGNKKAKAQTPNAEELAQIFKRWYESFDLMIEKLEDFMPLVADALRLAKKLIKVYEQGYLNTLHK